MTTIRAPFALLLLTCALPGKGDGVPALIRQLRSRDPATQAAAAERLAQLGPKAAAASKQLGAMLAHENEAIAGAAAKALAAIGKPAFAAIRQGLEERESLLRAIAVIEALGPVGAPLVKDLLETFRKFDEKPTQDAAAKAVRAIGAPAVDGLRQGTKVRAYSANAALLLVELKDLAAPAVPELMALVADKGELSLSRSYAANALGAIGSAAHRQVPKLLEYALDEKEEPSIRDGDTERDRLDRHDRSEDRRRHPGPARCEGRAARRDCAARVRSVEVAAASGPLPDVMTIHHGHRDGRAWCWSRAASLPGLIAAVPELVLGRIVAITAFDSGPLELDDAFRGAGWVRDGDVAISPRVTHVDDLPVAEWDEWYVFDERPSLPGLQVFVNWGDFTPSPIRGERDPTWCRPAFEERLDHQHERAEAFWAQLHLAQPFAFLADGDALTCVVDERMAERVFAALERLERRG